MGEGFGLGTKKVGGFCVGLMYSPRAVQSFCYTYTGPPRRGANNAGGTRRCRHIDTGSKKSWYEPGLVYIRGNKALGFKARR